MEGYRQGERGLYNGHVHSIQAGAECLLHLICGAMDDITTFFSAELKILLCQHDVHQKHEQQRIYAMPSLPRLVQYTTERLWRLEHTSCNLFLLRVRSSPHK